jgi:bacterioferritin
MDRKNSGSFTLDLEAIRKRARTHIENGALVEGYAADVDTVVRLLNEALATEIVCWLRYKRHASMASHLGGIAGEAIREELKTHATEELEHSDRIAQRITQLGGEPNYDPKGLSSRAHAEYVSGESLEEMLSVDLTAERIAIETYSEIIRYLGNDDVTTRRMMEEILKNEEEHADEIADWMRRLSPMSAKAKQEKAHV